MSLCESEGWRITCDGAGADGRGCVDSTGIFERVTSAVFAANKRDWSRLGTEWFCPACAWNLQIGLADLGLGDLGDQQPVMAKEGVSVIRIAD